MRITLAEVQNNIANIANREEYTADVIYELLAAYGRAKAAITQLQSGHLNKAEIGDSVLQKDVVYFRIFPAGTQLELQIQDLFEDPLTERYRPRYLIATDLIELAAKDTIKGTTLTIKLADIDNDLDFFYAWTGDEVLDLKTEAVADRRAADKMNELYVEIEKENRDQFASNPKFRHELNVFFTRLLFCFFAEDTGIYHNKQFTNSIKTFSQLDGSDLSWFFGELFKALDTKDEYKSSIKSPFKEFPYVNGSIFNTSKHSIAIPKFSAQARHLILECGRQNWGEINPDIFGTMFQGIVDPDRRDENGMDYTSVPNIMKVVQPLFLDELHEQYVKHYGNEKKLWALLNRISEIKIFDPACGSGNFLIISYKNLRQLQHKIIARINELKPAGLSGRLPSSNLLDVDHLYGIELDDFARELAILSIFLAKHQMNMEFNKQFGTSLTIIPLIELNTIVHGNAARLDWQIVCPNIGHTVTKAEQSRLFDFDGEQSELPLGSTLYDEIYLVGNPPYKGSKVQEKSHKDDIKYVFEKITSKFKDMDYIAIWFYKGSRYVSGTKARLSFVSTNSISQGTQVELVWPLIYGNGCEIIFAHTSFKWSNSARDQAGVTCVIIGLADKSNATSDRYIYASGIEQKVPFINSYLAHGPDVIVGRRSKPLCVDFPKMQLGNMAVDQGNFFFTAEQKNKLIQAQPAIGPYLRRVYGSYEYLNAVERYCLWIGNSEIGDARKIPEIAIIAENVRDFRSKSKDASTRRMATKPYQFREMHMSKTQTIILPRVSSERREYIPFGYLDSKDVVSDSAQALYDADPWLFALLESRMHMIWIRTVCGKLETRIRYSSALGYNTFPLNPMAPDQKDALNKSARRILIARAGHPDKNLAFMYDPDKMPTDLRDAHNENDNIVDNLYKKGGFKSDEERLAALFELYEKMIEKEKSK